MSSKSGLWLGCDEEKPERFCKSWRHVDHPQLVALLQPPILVFNALPLADVNIFIIAIANTIYVDDLQFFSPLFKDQ